MARVFSALFSKGCMELFVRPVSHWIISTFFYTINPKLELPNGFQMENFGFAEILRKKKRRGRFSSYFIQGEKHALYH
jgi:hypothetical protein